MIINGVTIDATFAEAFPMKATRAIITAQNEKWAMIAAQAMTGFATSVIACGCEAGIDRILDPSETPDGRPGVAVMVFAMGGKTLAKQLETRAGQCVLTSPTSALFAGIESATKIPLGKNLRYFGDGFQIGKVIGGTTAWTQEVGQRREQLPKRYWRIPVMDGEFLAEATTGQVEAVGGGNFLILGQSQAQVLAACEAAIEAMNKAPNVIMPFPGGVVRSGSKVGSKYTTLNASTNDAFGPVLKGATKTQLSDDIECVMEIVIDGLSKADIDKAMRVGIQAVCDLGAANGIKRISAGNYGGKLGPYHFHLQEIMGEQQPEATAQKVEANISATATAQLKPMTFTLKSQTKQRVDMSPLVPANLTGKSLDDIAKIMLQCGKPLIPVGELFDISGGDPQNIIINNSFDKLDFIGKELENGTITVNGDVGAYLGMGMKSGLITLNGNAGLYAACEMKKGTLEINGNTGDFLGGALPGNKMGMKGGTILIKGNVGARAGDHMRRGLILIEGDAGDYCGSRMTAGTIAVMGSTGRYLGYAMRRGTLLLWNKPQLLPSFNDCGAHTLGFLPLLFNSFKQINSKFAESTAAFNRVQRYAGDMSEIGRGEVLVKL
jgi:formylmethanofuran--tetrahydromethanopterin N-formyltransferase